MQWVVEFYEDFKLEFDELEAEVQDELLAIATRLEDRGPLLGRPAVDTLKGSSYPNMKELRFDAADGTWRVAFAFDPRRRAILLIAGDKSGMSHLLDLEKEAGNENNSEGNTKKSTSGTSPKNTGKSKRD